MEISLGRNILLIIFAYQVVGIVSADRGELTYYLAHFLDVSVAISEVLWYCVLLQREVNRRMAQENTVRVITIAATEQPQDIRLRVRSLCPRQFII